jgi:hypothetical protein
MAAASWERAEGASSPKMAKTRATGLVRISRDLLQGVQNSAEGFGHLAWREKAEGAAGPYPTSVCAGIPERRHEAGVGLLVHMQSFFGMDGAAGQRVQGSCGTRGPLRRDGDP